MTQEFTITISGLSDKNREMAAAELANTIKQHERLTTVSIGSDTATAMDAGTILSVILGSGSVGAVAYGIQVWMSRWNNAQIIISDKNRKIEINRIKSDEVIRALEAINSQEQG